MSLIDDIRANAAPEYIEFLDAIPVEHSVGESIYLFSNTQLEEQNAKYEVQRYMPGWFTIGTDNDIALLMQLNGSAAVWQLDAGALGSAEPHAVASSFRDWRSQGCPLPSDDTEDDLPLKGDLWLVAAPPGGLKDLLELKNVLRINVSLGQLKTHLQSIPCVIARGIACVALARRACAKPELARCISFSECEHPQPQYRVPP